MSVSHETTETSGVFWPFNFGNRHNSPAPPPADRPIIVSQVPGLQGEAHQDDLRKGRDFGLVVRYAEYDSEALIGTAVAEDDSKTLLGELLINGNTFGNATFLGVTVLPDQQGNGFRRDGKNDKWFCDAFVRWRLRS